MTSGKRISEYQKRVVDRMIRAGCTQPTLISGQAEIATETLKAYMFAKLKYYLDREHDEAGKHPDSS